MASRMTHGPAVQAIRKSLGIRQDVLARQARVSPSYLSRVENAVETPALTTTTNLLANGLGVPVAAITYPVPDGTTPGTMTHGPAIKAIRTALGLRQDALAAQAGIDGPRLSRIENGHETPQADATTQRLANGLGVPLDAITYPVHDAALLRESA